MGNDVSMNSAGDGRKASSAAHKHPYSKRLKQFKMSEDWGYIQENILERLDHVVSSKNDKLMTLICIGMDTGGILALTNITGEMPPGSIMSDVSHVKHSLLSDTEISYSLFGANTVNMNDYLAAILPDEQFHGRIAKVLACIFEGSPPSAPKISQKMARTVENYPSLQVALNQLESFHNRHLLGSILDLDSWTWADTAHAVLICFASRQREQQLYHVFGNRLSQHVLVSLAEESLSVGSWLSVYPAHLPASLDNAEEEKSRVNNLSEAMEIHEREHHLALSLNILRAIGESTCVV